MNYHGGLYGAIPYGFLALAVIDPAFMPETLKALRTLPADHRES